MIDLKNDRINITLRLRKPFSNAYLENVNLIIGLDYETSDVIPMRMKSAAILTASSARQNLNGLAINKIKAIGSLELKQQAPLPSAYDSVRDLYYENFFKTLEYKSFKEFIAAYQNDRNESTVYKYQSYYSYASLEENYVDIEAVIKIPSHQNIFYVPHELQIIKFAYIDYFSLWILIYVFLYYFFFGFIVKNRIFDCIDIDKQYLGRLV